MRKIKVYIIQAAAKFMREGVGYGTASSLKIFRGGNLTITTLAGICPDFCEVKLCDESYQKVDFSYDADLVALTSITCSANHAYTIADRFKKEKGSWIVMGGTHATVLPEECLQHVDSVCIGEGEHSFREICESVSKTGKAKQVYRNTKPVSLNNLSHPRRELLAKGGYYVHGIQATRGCPFSCEFCFIRHLYGEGYRCRPVDDVIREISETIHEKKFAFWDDNITADRNYAYELFSKLAPLGKQWISQCCVSIANDDELLKQAAKSGCVALFLGLESFNEDSLNTMKKGFNKCRNYKECIDKIHDHGIFVMAGTNFGGDGDDPFVFERSLEVIDYLKLDSVSTMLTTPMPGTDMTRRLLNEGRIFDFNWDHYDYYHVVFVPKKMTPQQLLEGHRWLMREIYSLPRIAKRLIQNAPHSNVSFFYYFLVNMGFRKKSKLNIASGRNPAREIIDGVEPLIELNPNYAIWADHMQHKA